MEKPKTTETPSKGIPVDASLTPSIDIDKKLSTTATGDLDGARSPSGISVSSSIAPSSKCGKCGKRFARRGCTQSACVTCCDDKSCATHNEAREQSQWKEQVLSGSTPLQLRAKEKRSKAIPVGRFKERDFSYLGDSVVLWDLQQYLANPTWREDAIRKSKKRRTRQMNHDLSSSTTATTGNVPTRKCRRQRFEHTMEALLKQSLS